MELSKYLHWTPLPLLSHRMALESKLPKPQSKVVQGATFHGKRFYRLFARHRYIGRETIGLRNSLNTCYAPIYNFGVSEWLHRRCCIQKLFAFWAPTALWAVHQLFAGNRYLRMETLGLWNSPNTCYTPLYHFGVSEWLYRHCCIQKLFAF